MSSLKPQTMGQQFGRRSWAEPWKNKMVEPLAQLDRAGRERAIREAGYNTFLLRSDDVYIDLLTDSGTSAMSDRQWAGMMLGDEAYAGSRNYYRLEDAVQRRYGYRYLVPVHQGRGAEHLISQTLIKPGDHVPGNMYFTTTRLHQELAGGVFVDVIIDEAHDPTSLHPFKGDVDLAKLDALVAREGAGQIAYVSLAGTVNMAGGQPVSMANVREVRSICSDYGIPLYVDACRFAENSFFVKLREEGYGSRPVKEIARELFSLADGCTMSAKKDGLANIGGFLCTHDDALARQEKDLLILTEGYPTYGGLAGRDLEAIAVGLQEALDEDYLRYRFASTNYLGERLSEAGVPIVEPPGGHAIYVDAAALLPHVPAHEYPGQAFAAELYLEAGVRSVEIGSVMFARHDPETGAELPAPMELVRLAIPRRAYTQSHVDYVIEAVLGVHERRHAIRGLRIVEQAPFLRHFTARFERL